MNRYKSMENREQISLMPMCMDDMIPNDCEVRAIDAIVDKMDIQSIGFTYSQTKETGRKPYSPVEMFKLYAYSYFNGIRSSRKIERECYRNIEIIWLIRGLKPDFKTIADFRKNNKNQIKQAFHKFSVICDELGLIGKEMVAVDGSKFRASNSRLAYHSEKKIEKKIEHYNNVAAQYLDLLDSCDVRENDCNTSKLSRAEIETKIESINKRLAELEVLKQRVKENGSICETDPDSRMMQTNNKGYDICHNVQVAVDDKNHLVVVVDVTSQPVDKEQLHNISLQAKEELNVEVLTVIADKGYYSAPEFAKCKEDNITPIVSKADHSHMAATKEYGKSQFKYDEEKDGYICPQGHLLKAYNHRKKYTEDMDNRRYQNFEACSKCPVKDKCSENKKGRTIQDRPFQRIADEVDRRTEGFSDMYKKRKQMVEHPFGTIKRALGFSYFLTRKTENVRTESLLHFFVYNMKRAINIVGARELLEILQG
jgi:transposase